MRTPASVSLFAALVGASAAAGAPAEPLKAVVTADPARPIGSVSPLIYGGFLEHFHRCVYGGVYEPGSPLADEHGFRKDVVEALRRIHVPVIRWPGGCFASAYHWEDGVGPRRAEEFDKAWRVMEPNTFGTDEFVAFCREVGAEPYICGNAGTGTPEEMSNWVEYCNLTGGKWARLRTANGTRQPLGVRYWSIGNENWGGHEIGAKTAEEFARFVTETAKMMKRVDGSIKLLAPSVPDIGWNRALLSSAGPYLDYIAVHIYSDGLWQVNKPAPYPTCAARSADPEALIARTEGLLDELGNHRVRIALDEWNLRGWHHPDFTAPVANIAARDLNDLNRTYTCADAVYAGCFLNACLRHADRVGMANFAPTVNVRGAIFTHKNGIVLRPTYHVFDLYVNHALPTALDVGVESPAYEGGGRLPAVDAALTCSDDGAYALAAVNRHDSLPVSLELRLAGGGISPTAELWTVTGAGADSFNDVEHPNDVALTRKEIRWSPERPVVELPPHSVSIIRFQAARPPAPAMGIANGGFEETSAAGRPFAWRPAQWAGSFRSALVAERPHAGRRCALLESADGADCAWAQQVRVKPHTRYRLAGWIRTEGVDAGSGRGALLNVQEVQGPATKAITGTTEWTRVEVTLDTGEHDSVQVNCLFGGWGKSKGKAWFDDVTLEEVR